MELEAIVASDGVRGRDKEWSNHRSNSVAAKNERGGDLKGSWREGERIGQGKGGSSKKREEVAWKRATAGTTPIIRELLWVTKKT
ncbi:hypothetical protein BHM03_00026443 [Ensete ventricosum]|uniref:Uncharacterized protein n=1 Tax=Ensete ventricosum TaxID=4639 RepID=A0A445MH99_ENSVE|nr:hypothetical protein BHM03_00026443 [Ensete ventricosum]